MQVTYVMMKKTKPRKLVIYYYYGSATETFPLRSFMQSCQRIKATNFTDDVQHFFTERATLKTGSLTTVDGIQIYEEIL